MVNSNELFHRQLAMWTASDRYDPGKMPEEAALVYTTDLYWTYKLNLVGLGLSQEFEDLAMDLLVSQLRWVVDQWRWVPQERIPLVFQEKLRWAEEELESMSKDR